MGEAIGVQARDGVQTKGTGGKEGQLAGTLAAGWLGPVEEELRMQELEAVHVIALEVLKAEGVAEAMEVARASGAVEEAEARVQEEVNMLVEEAERVWAVEEAERREVHLLRLLSSKLDVSRTAIGGLQSRGQRSRHWRQQWWQQQRQQNVKRRRELHRRECGSGWSHVGQSTPGDRCGLARWARR